MRKSNLEHRLLFYRLSLLYCLDGCLADDDDEVDQRTVIRDSMVHMDHGEERTKKKMSVSSIVTDLSQNNTSN